MVELRLFGVAVPSEDVEDVGLLLWCEEASAQLITGVGAVAAEITLHVGTQGGDVGGQHRSKEAVEAPGATDDAQLLEHRATFALTGRGEDGGAILHASRYRLARPMPHATGGQWAVEETEDVALGHVFETKLYIVVCHHSIVLLHGLNHLLNERHLFIVKAVLEIELTVDVGNGLSPVDVRSGRKVLEGDKLKFVSHDVLSYEY